MIAGLSCVPVVDYCIVCGFRVMTDALARSLGGYITW